LKRRNAKILGTPWRVRTHVFAIIAAALICLSVVSIRAEGPSASARRTVILLDGTWQIAEGGLNSVPAEFDRQVPVPGLVDMATPAFVEPGPRVSDRQAWREKDARRDAFWYRRTFEVKGPLPAVAQLKVGKAMFGARVFLNGILLGNHAASFTPGYFDARAGLRPGTNIVVIRVGADRDAVIGRAESGFDSEKVRYIPGIFDSVQLILSGTPHIVNVQAVPDIETHSASVHVWLSYSGPPADEKLHVSIREASTGRVAGEADVDVSAPSDGSQKETAIRVPIRNCRLWSPEDPFLYQLNVRGSDDSFSTRFGMRSFRLDSASGHAVLNGKPYFLRGTNLTLYRFFEDPQRGDKPWRNEWVRRYLKSLREMHWNAARNSIGLLPEAWYRIADEEGILLQDEFPIWTQQLPGTHNEDELAGEFREWMEERWNHPSVVIWDGANETFDPVIANAIRQVRRLDYSNRPWDAGWNVPGDPGDSDEAHPYHFIFGPDQPFRMYKLARDPGTRAGLFIAQPYADKKLLWPNAIIINEYGGLWLNRDGTPTTLSKGIYDYLLDPAATTAQRRELYARDMAALTEFFRVHRKAAGVLEFSGLDYSRPDGQTSDDFIDIEKLTRDPSFSRYVGDAFAPVGLMVDSWAEEYEAGASKEFAVLLVNDLAEDWKGNVRFRVLQGDKVINERVTPAAIPAFGTGRVTFSIQIPATPSNYQLEATLLKTPVGPVSSLRDFSVLTPEQREARRNLAQGQPVKALSERSDATGARYAVDGNGDTQWTPAGGGPQWVAVDLGQTKDVSHVLAVWNWQGYPKEFSIETSIDGTNWSEVAAAQKSDEPIVTLRFNTVAARWIRILIPGNEKAPMYSLEELEVYR
jgi:beta-galactosidase